MAARILTAEARDTRGKGFARKLRASGKIPAVLYGQGREGETLALSADEVTQVLAREGATSSVLSLEINRGKESDKRNVLIKEIQRHPVRNEVIHMDFLEISMSEKVNLMVPIELTGEAEGVSASLRSGTWCTWKASNRLKASRSLTT